MDPPPVEILSLDRAQHLQVFKIPQAIISPFSVTEPPVPAFHTIPIPPVDWSSYS